MSKLILIASLGSAILFGAHAKAEEFASKTGKFVKEGAHWIEYPAFDGVRHTTFSELARTKTIVALYDPTRNMILRLPLAGGMGTWNDLDEAEWNNLTTVTYKR